MLYQNIKKSKKRPLLDCDDPLTKIKDLLKIRQPFYEKADIILDSNNLSIKQTAEEIIKLLT